MTRKSKPIRVNKDLLEQLNSYRTKGGSWNEAVGALLEQAGSDVYWTLPSYTFKTKKAAVKEAMEQAVLGNLEYEDMEQPLKVRG